ncbi:hypothetical protein LTR36_002049 [Oleoguttula mirabilis]|uniref:Zn(2)-C6 fungal-type domain-containing protein n=1 Tax=Oleoguttula mirabilis TaxID=1507867 RepID=A0AAV9JM44_9PEZI|nr:hypothetical protein LTR36_002049 [Oleoguttula mirabilis]
MAGHRGPGHDSDSMPVDRPKKMQRISQACDLCHRRSIRCRPSTESPQQRCQNCFDFGVDCTYNRPSRRRRNPSLVQATPPNILPSQQGNRLISPASDDVKGQDPAPASIATTAEGASDFTGAYVTVREGRPEDLLGVAWRSFALASLSTVDQYLEIYMDCFYPIFPLFHGPILWDRIKKRHHLVDRGFFASVMAACALAAARARDGAIGDKYKYAESPEKSSEIFFAAAQDAIIKDLSKAQGFGYMRACVLLAITCIQYGNIKTMHQYMGTYHTLSAMQHFHDESHWPKDIPAGEREERRRLFWSTYTLDIYTSVVFDSVVHSQETCSNVQYPSEINDEDLTGGYPSPIDEEHWLRGWNFTTDLYRILEHAVKRMRRNKQVRDDRISIVRLLISDGIPDEQVMDNVLGLYYQLADCFKRTDLPATGDKSHDFIGVQAANIQATLQLVRITLFSTSTTHDVNRKCDVAQNVLETFHQIDPAYLRRISTPLVYHLGSIGQILASVMEGPLCEESYQRVRSLLVSMADLLKGLESGLQPTAGASRDLRHQIDKIDRYMDAQRLVVLSISQSEQQHQQQLHQHPPPQQHQQTMPGAINGLRNGYIPHVHSAVTNGMTMQSPFDEFQLPADLVNTGAWPWPFEWAQDNQMPLLQGFE